LKKMMTLMLAGMLLQDARIVPGDRVGRAPN
jgi:hypothetical protein